MRIIVVDIEASGFAGWPVEIGWSLVGSGSCRSMLIRPDPSWSRDLWDPFAEEVHGISQEMLLSKGCDPRDVMACFLEDATGATLISDAPEFDQVWLDQLFDVSNLSIMNRTGSPIIRSIRSVFPAYSLMHVEEKVAHRAGPDALELSNTLTKFLAFRAQV